MRVCKCAASLSLLTTVMVLAVHARVAVAQSDSLTVSQERADRPFVPGGIYDKPFIVRTGRASLGGYVDMQARYGRENGVAEFTFLLERLNLFVFAPVSERVRVAAEIEFEDGGEEVKIELGIVDFEIHPAATFRAGILLTPLGRFNLAHDSPANELTDRPLVSTEIIGVTLSEPGLGVLGTFYPGERSRITYEAYATNGYDDGVVTEGEGTQIPEGRGNFEDNNNHPSFVGRIAYSPDPALEVGLSGHTGPYNTWEEDGLVVDNRRDLSLLVVDLDAPWRRYHLSGEAAWGWVEIPASLEGVNAEHQRGYYLEVAATLFDGRIPNLPNSHATVVSRFDDVDFDTETEGDSVRRLTLGANLRVSYDTVFRLDYQYNWERDAFNNESNAAAVLFSVASYF
jgi:hypothetical protein